VVQLIVFRMWFTLKQPVQESQELEVNDCLDYLRQRLGEEEFQNVWNTETAKDFSIELEKYLVSAMQK